MFLKRKRKEPAGWCADEIMVGVVFAYEMKDGAVSWLKYKEKFVCWLLSNLCT